MVRAYSEMSKKALGLEVMADYETGKDAVKKARAK